MTKIKKLKCAKNRAIVERFEGVLQNLNHTLAILGATETVCPQQQIVAMSASVLKSTRRKPAAIAGPARIQSKTPSRQQGQSRTVNDDEKAQQGDTANTSIPKEEVTAAPVKSSQCGFFCRVAASAVGVAVVAVTAAYLSL